FPEELVDRFINLYSYKDELILDPFMGSGTTALAALNSNRKYVGYEINKEYCDLANNRIKDR
ncbi:MAG: site-specific DNA-methyltransferase, partial [Actinomycetota bacterium]|nr:site-specific DNA-methyltransferase [Actinomycetota bacterium]